MEMRKILCELLNIVCSMNICFMHFYVSRKWDLDNRVYVLEYVSFRILYRANCTSILSPQISKIINTGLMAICIASRLVKCSNKYIRTKYTSVFGNHFLLLPKPVYSRLKYFHDDTL